jgi:replicative DNA helicase
MSESVAPESGPERITTLKVPPHSVEAEQAVLGALMLDNSRWDAVHEVLLASDFYRREHRLIFDAMVQQVAASKPIDVITLSEALSDSNLLQEAGGLDYLGALVTNIHSASNVVAYAGIIKERAILRRLISVAHTIADSGYNPDGRPSADLLDAAEQAVYKIADERPRDGGPVDINPILKSAVARIEQLFDAKGSITGLSTGFRDLDEMTSGLQQSDLVIVAGRPSMGKCIVAGSRIVDPQTGARVPIDDIVAARRGLLHSLDAHLKFKVTAPSAFVDDGIKPTFRVTTALGREIETTLTHPFLTEDGWKPLGDMRKGMRIGIPRALPVFGTDALPDHELKLLAYLAADGGLTHTCPTFTNTNPRLLAEFTESVAAFGGLRVQRSAYDSGAPSLRVSVDRSTVAMHRGAFAAALRARMHELQLTARNLARTLSVVPATISYWLQGRNVPRGETLHALAARLALPVDVLLPAGATSASRNCTNPLTQWLDGHALWGKLASEKRIPDAIFRLPKPQLALFLNRLFACDGSAYVLGGRQSIISYASSSRELARDVQHLLLRFGVLARLEHRRVRYDDAHRDAWELVISHQASQRSFIDAIGIFGKEEQIERARTLLAAKQEHANADSLPEAACDYVLALKGTATWPEIFARKAMPCPDELNMHLSGQSRRLLSRSRARFFADLFDDRYLKDLADSDLYWDTIVAIESTGHKQVYDLTVPDTHNFVAEDVLVHNTTFAMNLVEHAILHQDKPVLVFSLEMPADSLIIRMLSSVGRIDQTRMRNGRLENDDWDKLSMAVAKLRNRPLFIDDTSGLSPSEMRARTRRVAREHGGIGLIMVDYLQLMQVKGSGENRTGEISEISRSLKLMAREFSCPVIALSQLNRSLEQRPNKRPVMSDLRESGAIEQDADVIMFVYRHEVYEPENEQFKGMAEIIIGKQRNGPIGTKTLSFMGKYTRFENYTPMMGGGGPAPWDNE